MADVKDISLEDIPDPILRSKVRVLIPAMGGSSPTIKIRDAILTCGGDINDATDLLLGDPPKDIRKVAGILEHKFPLRTKEQIMETLISCLGSGELAENHLSEQVDTEDNSSNESREQTATTSLNDQMPGYMREANQVEKRESANDNIRKSDIPREHQIIEIKDEEDDEKKISATKDISPSSSLTSLNSADIAALPGRIPRTLSAPATSENNVIAESSRSRIRFLHEIFPSVTEEECEDILRRCKGSVEHACEILQKRDAPDNHEDGNDKKAVKDCGLDARPNIPIFQNKESRTYGQKRSATTPDNLPHKRIKLQPEEEDEESADDETLEESFSLEPASEWLRKYFPGGRCATILLGPDEELRDTISRKVLYENSSFFSDYFDTAEAEEWEDDTVRLADVDPQMFDLVIQFLFSRTFILEPDPNRSKSTEISIILDLVFLAGRLGFPDPTGPAVEKLQELLIEDRRALRRKHVKRAFELEDGLGVQRLFVQAVIRDYMKTRGSRLNDSEIDTDDSDHDDNDVGLYRDAAHREFYNQDRFWFRKEFKSIRAFKYQILEEQDNVLKAGKKVVTRAATRYKNETHTIKYADPLDGEWFYL